MMYYCYNLIFGVAMRTTDLKTPLKMSDNELVKHITDGDYKCLQVLINRYMPYVINAASRYKVSGYDTEDFIQEGLLAIFSAVKSYKSEKSSFKTFVILCINRAMSSAVTKLSGAQKHIPESLISPIDEIDLPDMSNPESIIIEKEDYSDFALAVKNALSQFEYSVLSEFLQGKTYLEISKALGVSTKSVDNALKRIRAKLKNK